MRAYLDFFLKAPWRTKLWLMLLAGSAFSVFLTSFFAAVQLGMLGWQDPPSSEKVLYTSGASFKDNPAHASLVPIPAFSYPYELKNLSMPLVDKGATRVAYAQFGLILDCPSAEAKESMKFHRAKLMDTIFEVASRFYVEDFQTPKGFEKFKDALVEAYRASFTELAPRQVAIQNWFLN